MGASMRAVVYPGPGGSGNIEVVDRPVPSAGEGEVLVRVSRAGVNAADMILLDTGLNLFTGQMSAPGPVVPVGEVVGVREDTGERVVAVCGSGGYAEWVAVPESAVWPVPDPVSDADALTLTASGLTAWFLLEAAPVAPDQSVVVTGAAGALGSVVVQLAVKVFEEARAALARFGRIVVYGAASHESPLLEPTSLAFGSHTLSGVWLPDYVEAGLAGPALDRLFELHGRGELRTQPGPVFGLEQAHEAQGVLADRNTVGKVQIDVRAGDSASVFGFDESTDRG